MNYVDNPQRVKLIEKALSATTLEEVAEAEADLRTWVRAHPDDLGIRDAFEQLAAMRDAAGSEQSEAVPATARR